MWHFFCSAWAGVQKSLLSYFSSTTAPLSESPSFSCTIRSRAIPGPHNARPRKNPAPIISSNSGCGIQVGPTLAEVQDGPAPVALFDLKLTI